MASAKKMMTFELLDRMDSILATARTIPIYNRVMLEKEEFTGLMRRLQESIPADLQNARKIVEQEEQIINASNQEAEATRAQAAKEASDTVTKANQEARATVDSANAQANATLTDAQNQAGETIRSAADQANAMIADAQARANALVADAQARAQQLVSESEIIARAQAEAQELLDATHRDCDELTARVNAAMANLMDQADLGLSQQLDALRALRQGLSGQE